VLVEFSPRSIGAKQTVEVGRTSYGTGEYEKCLGQLFSIVFYPHHLVWSPTPSPGHYTPNPIHIEKFVVDPGPPENVNSAANTEIILAVSKDLNISDSVCSNTYGKSQQNPPPPSSGTLIKPGGVAYFDWWVCASPAEFCKGEVIDTLTFTATSSLGSPSFIDQLSGPNHGSDECQLLVTVDCADADINPPQFTDSMSRYPNMDTIKYINVHEWLPTDRGLASVTWAPTPSGSTGLITDTNEFTITVSPPIDPCYNDKINHAVTIIQKDSTKAGCFDFTFTDCIGNQSFHMVCLQAHQIVYPDTLPPFVEVTNDSITHWNIRATDSRLNDSGIDTVLAISDTNMLIQGLQFFKCGPVNSFTVVVGDTNKNASICLRFIDCAHNVQDTCIRYIAPIKGGVPATQTSSLTLEANRPNPFSQLTTFTYSTSEYGYVKLYLYDELGREVAQIIDGVMEKGSHSIDFDGSKLPSGNYIARLQNSGNVVSRKVMIKR